MFPQLFQADWRFTRRPSTVGGSPLPDRPGRRCEAGLGSRLPQHRPAGWLPRLPDLLSRPPGGRVTRRAQLVRRRRRQARGSFAARRTLGPRVGGDSTKGVEGCGAPGLAPRRPPELRPRPRISGGPARPAAAAAAAAQGSPNSARTAC